MDIREWLRNGEKENIFLIKDIATHGCSGGVGFERKSYAHAPRILYAHEAKESRSSGDARFSV